MGMTQLLTDDGLAIPVTVIQAGPCVVVQKKTQGQDGWFIDVVFNLAVPLHIQRRIVRSGLLMHLGPIQPLVHRASFDQFFMGPGCNQSALIYDHNPRHEVEYALADRVSDQKRSASCYEAAQDLMDQPFAL